MLYYWLKRSKLSLIGYHIAGFVECTHKSGSCYGVILQMAIDIWKVCENSLSQKNSYIYSITCVL